MQSGAQCATVDLDRSDPWAHLRRRYSSFWLRNCPTAAAHVSPTLPPAPPSSSQAPCSSASPAVVSLDRDRCSSSCSTAASVPRRWDRSFSSVVSASPASTMSGVMPQRPPQGAGPRMVAPRPQLVAAPPPRPSPQAVPTSASVGVGTSSSPALNLGGTPAGAGMGMVPPPFMPLQRPCLQYGPPAYFPPGQQFQPPPMAPFINPGYPTYQPNFQQATPAANQANSRTKRKKNRGAQSVSQPLQRPPLPQTMLRPPLLSQGQVQGHGIQQQFVQPLAAPTHFVSQVLPPTGVNGSSATVDPASVEASGN